MTVIDEANKYKKALEANDIRAIGRLADTYARTYELLRAKLAVILEKLPDVRTMGELTRTTRYKDLMKQIENELARYADYSHIEMVRIGRDGIDMGLKNSERLMQASLPGSVKVNFNKLPAQAVERALGFLQPSGPLFAKLAYLPDYYTELVSNLLPGIGMGVNPETTAKLIYSKFEQTMGLALTDVIRMTRTVQLYSYREATRANYLANDDVVDKWIWFASLDGSTCASCIAMHGKTFDLTEVLDDHHNGRCDMLPLLKGEANPIESGQDWFNAQDESKQREIMGDSKFEAYQAGKFELSQLSSQRDDDVYGTMRGEASLKELTGE